SAANRAACGIAEGDRVEAELQLDTAPRVVAEPPDLAEALNSHPQARAAFDRLAYGLKRKHVQAILNAKTPQAKQRRITKLITTIRGHHDISEEARPAAAAEGAPARQRPAAAPDQASSYSFPAARPPDDAASGPPRQAAYPPHRERNRRTPRPRDRR